MITAQRLYITLFKQTAIERHEAHASIDVAQVHP
jgi:hypothetical protein